MRVTVVSLVLPHDAVPSAGGGYVRDLHRMLVAEGHEVTFVVPDSAANRAATTAAGSPERSVLVGRGGRGAARLGSRLLTALDVRVRPLRRGRLPLAAMVALRRPGPAREAIAAADVVDLQWFQAIRLLPHVRRTNRGARVVGTFHDVLSQAFGRRPVTGRAGRWSRSLTTRAIARAERDLAGRLDQAIVFSAKDAALLGDPPTCRVVHPPLAPAATTAPHEPPPEPTALMVSYLARPENDEAARWLLRTVWPHVRAAVPSARLRLVGQGAGPALTAEAARASGVALPGFVPDLGAEYARATVAVVPLLRGAGVKFKTVEALLRGVPVVTTPVGAEGIGEDREDREDLFTVCPARPDDLVAGLVDVLRDPGPATARARVARSWATAAYGADQFRRGVLAGYGAWPGMGD